MKYRIRISCLHMPQTDSTASSRTSRSVKMAGGGGERGVQKTLVEADDIIPEGERLNSTILFSVLVCKESF